MNKKLNLRPEADKIRMDNASRKLPYFGGRDGFELLKKQRFSKVQNQIALKRNLFPEAQIIQNAFNNSYQEIG
jgi:hypothetical protein